jgi:hypothetical protein
VRRGKVAECNYSSSEQERKDAIDYRPHTRHQQTRQRVARLENLVLQMRDMAQSSRQPSGDTASPNVALNDNEPPLAPPDGRVVEEMGRLSLTDDHTVYTGSSHWVTILEDVSCLCKSLY